MEPRTRDLEAAYPIESFLAAMVAGLGIRVFAGRLFSVAVAGGFFLLWRVHRSLRQPCAARPPLHATRVWLTVASFAVPLLLGSAVRLRDTLGEFNLGLDGLPRETLRQAALVSLSALLCWSVSRDLLERLDRLGARALQRGLLVIACLLGLGSGTLLARSAAHLSLPIPERFLATRPVLGELPALASRPEGAQGPVTHFEAPSQKIYVDQVGGLLFYRQCLEAMCPHFGFSPSPSALRRDEGVPWNYLDGDAPARIRRDPQSGLLLLEQRHRLLASFCAGSKLHCAPEVRRLRGALCPPLTWIGGALLGVVLAGVSLWGGRSARRMLRARARWMAGEHDGRGHIALVRGVGPCLAPAGPPLPAGPVVVVLEGTAGEGGYREMVQVTATQALPGEPGPLEEALHAELAARHARTIAILALTAAPLLAFWRG